MSDYEVKQAYRLFWMVKGHINNVSHNTILSCADGYFKRLWGNHEACYREDGFEEAWQSLSWRVELNQTTSM